MCIPGWKDRPVLLWKDRCFFSKSNLKLNSELAKAIENTTQGKWGMLWFAKSTNCILTSFPQSHNKLSTVTMKSLHYVSYDSWHVVIEFCIASTYVYFPCRLSGISVETVWDLQLREIQLNKAFAWDLGQFSVSVTLQVLCDMHSSDTVEPWRSICKTEM